MRVVRILSGISVLLVALMFAHVMVHHLSHAAPGDLHSLVVMGLLALGVVVEIFAIVGAVLLFKG